MDDLFCRGSRTQAFGPPASRRDALQPIPFQILINRHKKRPSYWMTSFVGAAGFEPAAPCSQSRCANRTAPCPELYYFVSIRQICGERGIRTPGTCFQVRRFSKPVVSATHPPHRVTNFPLFCLKLPSGS